MTSFKELLSSRLSRAEQLLVTFFFLSALIIIFLRGFFLADWSSYLKVIGAVFVPITIVCLLRRLNISSRVILLSLWAAVIFAGVLELSIAPHVWLKGSEGVYLSDRLQSDLSRLWKLGDIENDVLDVNFRATLLEGNPEAAWVKSNFQDGIVDKTSDVFAVSIPNNENAYLMRLADFPEGLAGERIRLSYDLRIDEKAEQSYCQGLSLQIWEAPSLTYCSPKLFIDGQWHSYTIDEEIAVESTGETLRVVLDNLEGTNLELKNISFTHLINQEWKEIALRPAGLTLKWTWLDKDLKLLDSQQTTINLQEKSESVNLRLLQIPNAQYLKLNLSTPEGTSFRLQDLSFNRPVKAVYKGRYHLGLSHPNLAGASITMLSVISLLSFGLGVQILVIAVSVFLQLHIQSRTALIAFLLALGILLIWKKQSKTRITVTIIVVITLALFLMQGAFFPRIETLMPDLNERLSIWQATTKQIQNNLLLGVGEAALPSTEYLKKPLPTHAHNLILEFFRSFGLLGLFNLSFGLAFLGVFSWRKFGRRGMLVCGLLMLMNVFDYSFFFLGVQLPMWLFLCNESLYDK